jgi:pimeloyl-ACP methyl ester carboxylesterase
VSEDKTMTVPAPAATVGPRPRSTAIEPRFGEVMCGSSSGFHRIAYTEWGDPDAARVAICVHGLTRQGRDFDPLAVALAQRGYRVLCPDLAGRGRSGWLADSENYQLPQYVSDMAMVLARSGAAEVDWIGTSLGGLTGMHMASMANAPIRRMVVNDVGPYLPWEALGRLGSYLKVMPKSFASFHAAEAYLREVLAPYGRLGDTEWFHLTKHSISTDEDGRLRLRIDPGVGRAFRPVMFYNVSMWRQYDMIKCPILVLRGEHSDLLTREVAKEMTQRGPRAKVVEFPECGHAPALMDHRQIGTIIKWLRSKDPRAE